MLQTIKGHPRFAHHLPGLALLLLASLTAALPSAARAQGTSLGPVEPRPLSFLLTLPGDEVMVRYTPGSLDRAAQLQARLIGLQGRFSDWVKLRSRLVVYALNRDEWEGQGLARPFGVPIRVGDMAAAVPAWGDAGSAALWRRLTGNQLPVASEQVLRGSLDESSVVLISDSLVQLEMCRMFSERNQLAGGDAEPWLGEVVAHLLCLTYEQSGRAPPPVNLAQTLRRTPRGTETLPLADYEPAMELEPWLGYQARFAAAAEQLWLADGKKAVKKVLKMRRQKGRPLRFGEVAGEYPALVGWRESAFR